MFTIKQENYLKPPTAEQRKVWTDAWHLPRAEMPVTRIAAHLKIRELLTGEGAMERKAMLKAWQARRKELRALRRMQAEAEGNSNA